MREPRGKVVSLRAVRSHRAQTDREHAWNYLRAATKRLPKEIDGFALVAYKREKDGGVWSETTFSVRDPADRYHLPDLAASQIRRILANEGG